MKIYRLTSRAWIGLALVLIAAAVMRFAYPGVVEFLHDEAMMALMAQDMVHSGEIPLTGIVSSVGIPNPPVSVYLMALPYLFSDDPLMVTMFVAALNVIGVGLLYLLAYRYFGLMPALVAGLVYAVNPWAVLYSRKIWAQDFQTPFLLLALLVSLVGFYERKRWAQLLALPLLLIALQIHFAAWALLPLYFYLLLIRPAPPVSARSRSFTAGALTLLISFILGGLTLLPYGIGLARTLEADPNRITNAFERSGAGISLSEDALLYNAGLATGSGLETFVATTRHSEPFWLVIMGGAVLLGLLLIWRSGWSIAGLVLLWVSLPLIVFSLTWTEIYPHYFIISIPALCLLIGAVFISPTRPGRGLTLVYTLAAGLIGVVLVTQAVWWRDLITEFDQRYVPNAFSTPLHYILNVRDSLRPYENVLVLTDGIEIIYDQEPARWSSMLYNSAECVRALSDDGRAVFPSQAFAVLVAPNAPENPVGGLYAVGEPQVFPLRPDEGAYRLYTFEADHIWNGTPITPIDSPPRFDSGALLTGYALEADRFTLQWRLVGPVSQDYQYFVHFLDATGERIGQRDDRFWPGRYWCENDRLLTWGGMEVPAETQMLRVGLYVLENGGFVNANVVDDGGNPIGLWADIAVTSP